MAQPGRTPTIVVRSTTADGTIFASEEAVADDDLLGSSVPQPKDKHHRSSWTDSLWGWTGSAPRRKDSSRKNGKQRVQGAESSGKGSKQFQPSRPRASTTISETAAIGKPVLSPPMLPEPEGDDGEDHSFRYGDRGNTPSFRAIFLATRLLTPDMSSILSTASKKRLQGETLSRMAYSLVRNSRDTGITLRSQPTIARLGRDDHREPVNTKSPTKRSKRHSVLGLPSSLGNALASPVQAFLASGSSVPTQATEGEAARKQLLRSISSRDMAGTLSTPGIPVSKGKSPDRSAMSTPIVSPGEHDGESTPPLVEMDAFIADKDKPPTMLPRRNTMHNLHSETSPSLKLASRFGDESAELAPYTDKFGFVYDLRYVRMLLDLKAASEEDTLADMAPEEDEMPRVKRDPRASFDEHALERVKSDVSFQSNSSPGSVCMPLPESSGTIVSNGQTPHRPRSSTLAVFNPSPAKPSASHQDVTVSSRGAFNLRPTITANGGRKDSVRLQKAKLDSLAVRHRKPVSALLDQLGEVQDVREAETARQWEQFIKYRRGKTSSRKGSVSAKHKSLPGLDHASWQDDLVGIANIGDGKTGQEVMKRFKTLIVSSGIPINLRASIWAECSGAKDAFIPGEYHEILSVHKYDEHPVLGDIEKDVK